MTTTMMTTNRATIRRSLFECSVGAESGTIVRSRGCDPALVRLAAGSTAVVCLWAAVCFSRPLRAQSALVTPVCSCERNRIAGGWCGKCDLGYLAGVCIESKLFFEMLDAHGHVIDPGSLSCEKCRAAQRTQGYCDGCRMGFVRGMAYLSKLTYHLAQGRPTNPASLVCKSCADNAKQCGWCEKCAIGMIGNVAIPHRADYDAVLPEFQRMLDSIKLLPRCEQCAMAHFSGGICMKCHAPVVPPTPMKREATPGGG